ASLRRHLHHLDPLGVHLDDGQRRRVIRVELLLRDGPAAVRHPATRLEIARVEWCAPSLPMIRSAPEIPKATPQWVGALVAHAFATVEGLHVRIEIEPSTFDDAN